MLKYDSLGVLQYTFAYDNGGYDNGNAIKIDGAGYAYIAGTSYNATTGLDYIVFKISPTGSQVWMKRFDRGYGNDDEALDICVDNITGDVYLTGKSKSASGSDYDIVSLRLDAGSGTIMWQHNYTGSGSNLDDVGTGIILSSNGQIAYVAGNTNNSSTGSDIVFYAADINTLAWITLVLPLITNGTS